MRPIGQRIRQVLEIVDKQPGAIYSEIAQQIGIESTNAYKYCQRAAEFGLLVVDRSTSPTRYTTANDWRQVLAHSDATRRARTMATVARKQVAPRRVVNSVWSLACK